MMGHKAIVHIFSSHNNILITATDLTGAETICKVSGGIVVGKGSAKSGQFSSTRAAEQIAEIDCGPQPCGLHDVKKQRSHSLQGHVSHQLIWTSQRPSV